MICFITVVLFTADKKDDSSKVEETGTDGNETEEPPTTYSVKEKYHYFKPRVEVETEEEGNKSHVKEIYIRGESFLKCWIKRFINLQLYIFDN